MLRSSSDSAKGHQRITGEAASSCTDANSLQDFHHALVDAERPACGVSVPFQANMLCVKNSVCPRNTQNIASCRARRLRRQMVIGYGVPCMAPFLKNGI